MSKGKRAYTSPLREQRAEETRRRILEGAATVLAEGAAGLTIPAVAKASGVAVPTVYRYFGSKEELEDGVAQHVRAQLGIGASRLQGLDALLDELRVLWTKMDAVPRSHLVLMLGSAGRELIEPNSAAVDRRVGATRDALQQEIARLDAEAGERVVKIVSALRSSPAGVAYMRLGLTGEEAADLHAFVLEAVLEKALREAGE